MARSFNEVDSHATIEEPRKQVINLFNVASAPRSDLMSSVSGRAEELLGAAKVRRSDGCCYGSIFFASHTHPGTRIHECNNDDISMKASNC